VSNTIEVPEVNPEEEEEIESDNVDIDSQRKGKDSYLIPDTLPSEYYSRVEVEVDTRPTEQYSDIDRLDT